MSESKNAKLGSWRNETKLCEQLITDSVHHLLNDLHAPSDLCSASGIPQTGTHALDPGLSLEMQTACPAGLWQQACGPHLPVEAHEQAEAGLAAKSVDRLGTPAKITGAHKCKHH